jgi:hypothetical protein
MTKRTREVGNELRRAAEAAERRRARLVRKRLKRARHQAAPTRAMLDATVAARVDGSTA